MPTPRTVTETLMFERHLLKSISFAYSLDVKRYTSTETYVSRELDNLYDIDNLKASHC